MVQRGFFCTPWGQQRGLRWRMVMKHRWYFDRVRCTVRSQGDVLASSPDSVFGALPVASRQDTWSVLEVWGAVMLDTGSSVTYAVVLVLMLLAAWDHSAGGCWSLLPARCHDAELRSVAVRGFTAQCGSMASRGAVMWYVIGSWLWAWVSQLGKAGPRGNSVWLVQNAAGTCKSRILGSSSGRRGAGAHFVVRQLEVECVQPA